MLVRVQSSRKTIKLEKELGRGGEGSVFPVPSQPNLVAKVYHKPDPTRAKKLKAMLLSPPKDPGGIQHTSIAWPQDILLEDNRDDTVKGYVMPRVSGAFPIMTFYDVNLRHKECPSFDYRSLCRTALNLSQAATALHDNLILIGDVNDQNILVYKNALVTLIDTDSFQITDLQRNVYRCTVGTDRFTPPELSGKKFSNIDRNLQHDRFGLAVLFFMLLMEGTHPFSGRYSGPGDPPDPAGWIKKGYFAHSQFKDSQVDAPTLSPPFDMLHPELRNLFIRCFVMGHSDPFQRPSMKEWTQALQDAQSNLRPCQKSPQHYYFNNYQKCPWCERAQQFRANNMSPDWDSFPDQVQAKAILDFQQAKKSTKGRARPAVAAKNKRTQPPTAPVSPAPTQKPAQPSSFFTASSTTFTIGQSVTLQWQVPNAQALEIKVGRKRIHTANGLNASAGTLSVTPTRDITYKISAMGPGVVIPGPITLKMILPAQPVALTQSLLELKEVLSMSAVSVQLSRTIELFRVLVRLYATVRLKTPILLKRATISLKPYMALKHKGKF